MVHRQRAVAAKTQTGTVDLWLTQDSLARRLCAAVGKLSHFVANYNPTLERRYERTR